MSALQRNGQLSRPLILGGNTAAIAADLAGTGATVLLCDYACDSTAFAASLAGAEHPGVAVLSVRRNVDPGIFSPDSGALWTTKDDSRLAAAAARLLDDLQLLPHPVAGTGILPFGQNPETVGRFLRRIASSARPVA
ncbi:MAG: hypothetical protein E4H09_00465 [Spirochaetales bacterium]|nr:MAG: hypothetical protein E4H09_00465 [Spirochaetales bacterium]